MRTNLDSLAGWTRPTHRGRHSCQIFALALSLLAGAAFEARAALVALSWQDNSNNELGFKIERATGTGVYAEIATTAPNVVSYTDTAVAASTSYQYRVRSFNAAGSSTPSNIAAVTTAPASSNSAPTISDITNRTINEDASTGAVTFTVGAAETAAGSLVISGSSSNTTLVPNTALVLGGSGASRTITATPASNQNGTTTITVTVSDGTLSSTDTFVVTVSALNDAPTITNITDQTIGAGTATTALTFTIDDVETSAAGLTLIGTSSNTTLAPNTAIVFGGAGTNRTVTVTPPPGQTGTATITISVSDGALSASDTFVLTVNAAPNTAPTISNLVDQTVNEDTATGALTFTVGDSQTAAGSLVVSASSSNTALVPNAAIILGGSGATRTVMVTPAANLSGTAIITMTVSDGALSASDPFTVTVAAVNDTPTISDVANQSLNEDSGTSDLAFAIGDIETAATSLAVSGSSSNTALVPNSAIVFAGTGGNRTVTITPAENQNGTATITLTVSEGALSASDSFTVTVTAVNDAPTISDVANQSVDEDTATPAVVFAIGDVETAATSLTVSASSSNTALVPNTAIVFAGTGTNRTVTTTPAANQYGLATITITVSDGGLTTTDAFTLSVAAVNDAPTITPLASPTIDEDSITPALAFTVGDVETPATSLVVTGLSSNATLVPPAGIALGGTGASRTITLTPAANQNGVATITVTASDGTASTTVTFDLAVTAVNDPPTITDVANQSIPQGTATSAITFTVGDVESTAASLTVSGTSSNTTLVPASSISFGGTGATRTVTVTPIAGQSGSATITVAVSDGAASRTDSFVLTVTAVAPANLPPTVSPIPDQTGTLADPGAIGPFAFAIADPESAAAGLIVSATSSNTALVPSGGITLGGTGADRSITITPAAGQTGAATITITVSDGTDATNTMFTVTISAPPPAATRLLNLSTRVVCRPNREALIPGFVITGPVNKRILLRAVGPTLGAAPFHVPGALPNPRVVLKRWNGAAFVDVANNDNWSTNANAGEVRQVSASLFAFAVPDDSLDAALLLDLAPGQYTVVADDGSGAEGVVILELYDADATPGGSSFVNMSNRGYVGTGVDVMISGFVVSDEGAKTLLVRAVGPGLASAPYHVPDTISDPLIEIYRHNRDGSDTLIVTHDNWGEDGDAAAIVQVTAQVAAFPLAGGSKDVAFVTTFAPGVYTAVIRGVNGATGSALVEIYATE